MLRRTLNRVMLPTKQLKRKLFRWKQLLWKREDVAVHPVVKEIRKLTDRGVSGVNTTVQNDGICYLFISRMRKMLWSGGSLLILPFYTVRTQVLLSKKLRLFWYLPLVLPSVLTKLKLCIKKTVSKD